MERFAVLIDLSTIRIGTGVMEKLVCDLKSRGTIEYIKFYNYNTKRHRELRSFVREHNVSVELPMSGKKRVRIDIRQVMDAVEIASTNANITTFFLICSEVDGVYLFDKLKSLGKLIEMGVTSPTTLSTSAHNIYIIDRMEELRDIEDEVAIANVDSKVKGGEDGIFPYTDIDSSEISQEMAKIDAKLIEMIRSKKEAMHNIDSIFGK